MPELIDGDLLFDKNGVVIGVAQWSEAHGGFMVARGSEYFPIRSAALQTFGHLANAPLYDARPAKAGDVKAGE